MPIMAVGDTAVSMQISNPPLQLDLSPSNMSSPLSDVEDKDADPEDIDLEVQNHNSPSLSNVNLEDEEAGASEAGSGSGSGFGSENDESNLSEIDANDSEAETERLYHTPPKSRNIRDPQASSPETGAKQFGQPRDRAFEPSPSNLNQEVHADLEPNNDGDEESLSGGESEEGDEEEDNEEDNDEEDGEDEPEDDGASDAPGLQKSGATAMKSFQGRSSSQEARTREGDNAPADADQSQGSTSDARKRKRSPAADQSESDQPLRKRISSVATANREVAKNTGLAEEDEGTSTNPQSGEHSGAEDEPTESGKEKADYAVDSIEGVRAKKSARNDTKKRKGSDDGGEEVVGNVGETAGDAATSGHAGDEQIEANVGEEAEAAHKNEEELERKRAAFDQLQAIEKHFATFRERLYHERLSQLNQEEAMLTGDAPTHPDYLAMMQCIDARYEEKVRIVDLEYKFNAQALKCWAVARRAQIHGQYFQSVRDSRESVLEELGRKWYQIQQQRRRHANAIPDYGIRFPTSKAQRTKDAIAYNKEVSILSGIAKHEGFPAAPQIKGASAAEIEEDFEEIARAARQGTHQQAAIPSSFQELSGLSFNIGVAGQRYLADTPWANPNHPSHHVQRQRSRRDPRTSSPPSGPPGGRMSHQASGHFSSPTDSTTAAANMANGEPSLAKPQPTVGLDNSRRSKLAPEMTPKRESIV